MSQAEKERKKILVTNSVHTRPRQENFEKKSKKILKIKKPHPGVIFNQNGMRQAVKERKKFQSRIPFILDPSKKVPKKMAKKFKTLKKPLSSIILSQSGIRQAEKENKILAPNSVPTQPELENSKKNSKKIQKIKKVNSGIISIRNGLRLAGKEGKKFQSQIPFILDPGKKVPKEIAKKFKKLKNLIPALFLAKTG